MEEVTDKNVHPGPTEGWNPYDEYDCRPDADTPKQTQEYIDHVLPSGVTEAIAKREAQLKAEKLAAELRVLPKKE